MAIEDIFRALDEQAEEECQALLSHARAQAERIVEQAKVEADGARTDRLAHTDRELAALRNQRSNTSRLEGKKRASAEREKLVQEAFKKADERVAHLRGEARYEQVFERLLSEAVEGYKDQGIVVHVDPRDADLAKKVMERLAIAADLSTELDTAGGVRVGMAEGKVVRLNTLESRLAKARRIMKSDVAQALFGG